MAKGTVNKVIILGRLGQDPEVRATAGGTQVVNLNVATNELGPKDETGTRQDLTEWHRCVLFGRTAEIAAQYLKKGSQVYLEGRLQTRKWQDQQGNDRYSTEIVANEMQLMGSRNDQADSGFNAQPTAPQQGFGAQGAQNQQPRQQQQQQPQQQQYGQQQQQQQQPQQPQQPQQQYGQQPKQQQQPAQQPSNSFDDFDDDIPF